MSTQGQRQAREATVESISEQAVVDYLYKNPDFFERHATLLAGLKLPHRIGGAAVSLVERQVSILRQRNNKTERKLRELVSVARANEALSGKIHTLCLGLMEAPGMAQILTRLHGALHDDFGADQATLILFGDSFPGGALDTAFVRTCDRADPALKAFATFVSGNRPRCGQMRDVQREFLFGQDNLQIGSAALVPLGKGCELGMLAIGNNDSTHFHPAMSTDFLGRLGEVITIALKRYPVETAA